MKVFVTIWSSNNKSLQSKWNKRMEVLKAGKKNQQPNVWGVHFVSLRKEYPLAELDWHALIVQRSVLGVGKLFPCCQEGGGEHWSDYASVCEGRAACKLLLQNHQKNRIEIEDNFNLPYKALSLD